MTVPAAALGGDELPEISLVPDPGLRIPSALVSLDLPAAEVCVDGWCGVVGLDGDADQVAQAGGEGAEDPHSEPVDQGRGPTPFLE
jgi:hypothetical protein